jgi:hypothetical protein
MGNRNRSQSEELACIFCIDLAAEEIKSFVENPDSKLFNSLFIFDFCGDGVCLDSIRQTARENDRYIGIS